MTTGCSWLSGVVYGSECCVRQRHASQTAYCGIHLPADDSKSTNAPKQIIYNLGCQEGYKILSASFAQAALPHCNMYLAVDVKRGQANREEGL